MNHHDIFDSLANNAFDFLEHGINEFDKAPKYSVIHFCAAVEILLKARLMMEDWSLIVSDQKKANFPDFEAGNFKSVSMDEARKRLRNCANECISQEAFNIFQALADHRNKMVHFFHSGIESDECAKEQIVAEQCRSWFHLHQLLKSWESYFQGFQKEISHADYLMKSHRKYLSTKFETISSTLDDAACDCNACGFKAAIPDFTDEQIASIRCLVCDHKETEIEIFCPHCNQSIIIENEGFATCEYCGGEIEPEYVSEHMIDHESVQKAISDGDDRWQSANCGNCDGHHTVVRREEGCYFCVCCFNRSEYVAQCKWCLEWNTGDMEHSYEYGCGQCDGKFRHERDK
ncbi:MAG: hypothetical protein HQL95_04435 [Magnetococcales bacterium]|nr:hypothetical protein [Magnetococcales bacterium]